METSEKQKPAPELKQPLTPVKEKPKDFPGMLKAYLPEIARALPRHMTADRMARIALTAFRMQPKLAECEPASIFACIIQASQLGLEVGINGQAYLVPFWNNKKNRYECQLIPGYRGLIDLARRTAQVESVSAHIVFSNDEYDLVLGTEEHVKHKPRLDGERGSPVFGYCVAKFKDGGKHIEPMTWAEIQGIKDRTKSRNRDGEIVGPWVSDENEMARKTVVRRASKYWPMSIELQTAIALDDAAQRGEQSLTIKDAIEGTWIPIPESDTTEAGGEGKTDAPTMQDALNAVKSGDLDLARDIKNKLNENERAHIEKAIENRIAKNGKQGAEKQKDGKTKAPVFEE